MSGRRFMSGGPQMARLPWYPRDFASSTQGWPLISRAVYRELLDASWDIGPLPADAEILRRIVGALPTEWDAAWPLVSAKFETGSDGKLRNARLEEHRAKAFTLWQRHSAGARTTNAKRWPKVVPIHDKAPEK